MVRVKQIQSSQNRNLNYAEHRPLLSHTLRLNSGFHRASCFTNVPESTSSYQPVSTRSSSSVVTQRACAVILPLDLSEIISTSCSVISRTATFVWRTVFAPSAMFLTFLLTSCLASGREVHMLFRKIICHFIYFTSCHLTSPRVRYRWQYLLQNHSA